MTHRESAFLCVRKGALCLPRLYKKRQSREAAGEAPQRPGHRWLDIPKQARACQYERAVECNTIAAYRRLHQLLHLVFGADGKFQLQRSRDAIAVLSEIVSKVVAPGQTFQHLLRIPSAIDF